MEMGLYFSFVIKYDIVEPNVSVLIAGQKSNVRLANEIVVTAPVHLSWGQKPSGLIDNPYT
jgi:hypothetical protein